MKGRGGTNQGSTRGCLEGGGGGKVGTKAFKKTVYLLPQGECLLVELTVVRKNCKVPHREFVEGRVILECAGTRHRIRRKKTVHPLGREADDLIE